MSNSRIPKEYLGAFKCGYRKSLREFIDEELSWVLLRKINETGCEEAKAHLRYIARFNQEFYVAALRVDSVDPIHSPTPEMVSELDRKNYVQKNDVLNGPNVIYLEDHPQFSPRNRQVYLEPLLVRLSEQDA